MSASALICYCSGYPAVFGFWASLSTDNFTLMPTNKVTDQSLCNFQTGIGAAAHAFLDTEHLISHARTALVDTVASLQGSEGGMIVASEVHELLTKIYKIMDNALSKWVDNTTLIFNSASRQCHEVWVPLFPFLHNINNFVPPSEACLLDRSTGPWHRPPFPLTIPVLYLYEGCQG